MNLDEAQKNVSRLPVDSKTVVHAGPGSGKSLTLIERLKFLISEAGVSVGEILVISFSVAAKEELENRIKKSIDNDDLRFINPRTLDSLATQIIVETTGTCVGSFSSRIRQAQKIIDKLSVNSAASIDGVRHILVDEAQDIVGYRAELLLAILRRVMNTSGFTIFADSAQSIYDFQIEENNGMKSDQMIKVIETFGANTIRLENYYRSDVQSIKDICRISWAELLKEGNKLNAFTDLLTRLKSLKSIGGLWVGIRTQELTGNTKAILCRTNYQLLAIAAMLRERNPSLNFIISRRERSPQRPYWISKLLFGVDKNTVLDESSLGVSFKNLGSSSKSLDEVILYLKKQLRLKRNEKLYGKQIVAALNEEINFTDILNPNDNKLTISTIHRSKGKEYDSVAVFDEYSSEKLREMFTSDKESHACSLFVALSRARSQLVRFVVGGNNQTEVNVMAQMKRVDSFTPYGGKRAIECGFRHNVGRILVKFEIGLHGDVDSASFVINKSQDVILNEQHNILPQVKDRSNVVLKLNNKMEIYEIYIDGYDSAIGSMSLDFTNALKNTMALKNVQDFYYGGLPIRLEGGWIRGLVSASIAPNRVDEISKEIIQSGIWSCLELEGWAKLIWHD
jgi:AAA domain